MKWIVDTDVFFAAVNANHIHHAAAHRWLESIRSEGWGVTVETFLAAVRLLMNPIVMHGHAISATKALRIVRAELSGGQPGRIVPGPDPEDRFLAKANGHKQVMDFYLVQIAAAHEARLATFDRGTLAAWPRETYPVST